MTKIIPILTADNVVEDLQWTYRQRGMDFNKNLGLTGQYCHHPFNTITVDGSGEVYMCICQAWLPISVGKIWNFDTFEDIVNSDRAKEIQASILDGSYRYCDHTACGLIQEGNLESSIQGRPNTITWINFALDSSCNLTCPSCRTEFKFINEDSGQDFKTRMGIVDHLIWLIENRKHWLKFSLSSDGDPFASIIYRHLLSKLDLNNKSDVEIELITNGILVKAHWHKLKKIHNNIVRTKISFDAASEAVYNITRRGGDWNKLLESVEYVVNWKKETASNMTLTSNFVVQTANYKEMASYVELCDSLGFDEINFQKIMDWGTFKDFSNQAVWDSAHPLHHDFISELSNPILNNPKVNFTNLTMIKNEIK